MTRRQLIGLSPFAAVAALLLAEPHIPYQATHVLGGGCYWVQRASWATFGPGEPDIAAREAQLACFMRRGAMAPEPIPIINRIERKFPSQAELAAWREDDAN